MEIKKRELEEKIKGLGGVITSTPVTVGWSFLSIEISRKILTILSLNRLSGLSFFIFQSSFSFQPKTVHEQSRQPRVKAVNRRLQNLPQVRMTRHRIRHLRIPQIVNQVRVLFDEVT